MKFINLEKTAVENNSQDSSKSQIWMRKAQGNGHTYDTKVIVSTDGSKQTFEIKLGKDDECRTVRLSLEEFLNLSQIFSEIKREFNIKESLTECSNLENLVDERFSSIFDDFDRVFRKIEKVFK